MFYIYFLISEFNNKTYVGFTNDIKRRIDEHFKKENKYTKNFGNFKYTILEKVDSLELARKREKHWKSCAGRKKLKILFDSL